MTVLGKELTRLLNRAALARGNIDKTMLQLAATMPTAQDLGTDIDTMVKVIIGSLEMMEEAANDYALTIRDCREYVAGSLKDRGIDV